jgi:hypothetical protein
MLEYIKNLFGKKKRVFTEEEQTLYAGQKEQALEHVLGKMHGMVGHAIIPFRIGGAMDMYYFPQHIAGTGFATMELLEPAGSGSKPNRFGTYELVAFTKHPLNLEKGLTTPFNEIERRCCGIFTLFGNYSFEAVLNPGETCEIPLSDTEYACLILSKYADISVNGRKHHLMLLQEVFRSEMDYARRNGSASLLEKLKKAAIYPYSDMDREPVV